MLTEVFCLFVFCTSLNLIFNHKKSVYLNVLFHQKCLYMFYRVSAHPVHFFFISVSLCYKSKGIYQPENLMSNGSSYNIYICMLFIPDYPIKLGAQKNPRRVALSVGVIVLLD